MDFRAVKTSARRNSDLERVDRRKGTGVAVMRYKCAYARVWSLGDTNSDTDADADANAAEHVWRHSGVAVDS